MNPIENYTEKKRNSIVHFNQIYEIKPICVEMHKCKSLLIKFCTYLNLGFFSRLAKTGSSKQPMNDIEDEEENNILLLKKLCENEASEYEKLFLENLKDE
jgi:hypothetical protein